MLRANTLTHVVLKITVNTKKSGFVLKLSVYLPWRIVMRIFFWGGTIHKPSTVWNSYDMAGSQMVIMMMIILHHLPYIILTCTLLILKGQLVWDNQVNLGQTDVKDTLAVDFLVCLLLFPMLLPKA